MERPWQRAGWCATTRVRARRRRRHWSAVRVDLHGCDLSYKTKANEPEELNASNGLFAHELGDQRWARQGQRSAPARSHQVAKHAGYELVAEFYDAPVSGADPIDTGQVSSK
jgi:hypothetical protein